MLELYFFFWTEGVVNSSTQTKWKP